MRIVSGMALVVALVAGCGGGGGHPAAVSPAKTASPGGTPTGTPTASGAQAQTLKAALSPAGDGEQVVLGPVAGTVATLGAGDKDSKPLPGLSARCRDVTGTPNRWPAGLGASPAAMIMKRGAQGVSSEQLVLIPATTDPHTLRVSVPPGCPPVTTRVNGRTVKLRMVPLGRARLPRIPGADVTAVELSMTFPEFGLSGGTIWMNVRQGRLLMAMSFIGTTSRPDASMKPVVQRAWTLARQAGL